MMLAHALHGGVSTPSAPHQLQSPNPPTLPSSGHLPRIANPPPLCSLPPSLPLQDNLALHAINFLTAVSRSVHYTLFKDPTALRQICESIVIPNLKMREDVVSGYVWLGVCGWLGVWSKEGKRRGGREVHGMQLAAATLAESSFGHWAAIWQPGWVRAS